MARVLQKAILLCDSVVDDEPQGRIRLMEFEDDEYRPIEPSDVAEYLWDKLAEVPEVAAALMDEVETDVSKVLLNAIEAAEVSASVDATAFVSERLSGTDTKETPKEE